MCNLAQFPRTSQALMTTITKCGVVQLLQNRDCTHPMKEDVKKKHFSPPLGKTRVC